MLVDEQFDPPLEVALTEFYSKARFRAPHDLRAWFEKERDWLVDLRNRSNQSPEKEALATNLFQQLVALTQRRVDAVQQIISRQGGKAEFQQLLNEYIQELEARRLLHSGGRVGILVSNLGQAQPVQATRVASCYCRLRFNANQCDQAGEWMRAAAISVAAEMGLENNGPALQKMVGDFGAHWTAQFIHIEAEQQAILRGQGDALEKFHARSAEGSALVDVYETESRAALMEGKAQLEAVKETYKTELALQAPTSYWRAKQVSHRWVAGGWGAGFALAVVFGGLFVWKIWNLTAQPYLEKMSVAPDGAAGSTYGVFLPTAGAAFLVVWILRILSRQLLANFTLGSDAGERVAMVKTFLSLMQRPEHVREDDRILILSSLFRPSLTSGDDATPPNWFDLLMQRVKKE